MVLLKSLEIKRQSQNQRSGSVDFVISRCVSPSCENISASIVSGSRMSGSAPEINIPCVLVYHRLENSSQLCTSAEPTCPIKRTRLLTLTIIILTILLIYN